MKFKKVIFTSMAAVSLSAVITPAVNATQNTVEASTTVRKLTKNAYIYNVKGKRVKKVKLVKGKKIKILGTKLINGKKYYRIGKNQYIKVANFKVLNLTNPEVNTGANTNTNTNISPTPTEPSVPNGPQQQPTTPPSNNNGGISNSNGNNTDKPTKPTTPPTNDNSSTTNPTKTPATQADKDALIAYLKQVNAIKDTSNIDFQRYFLSTPDDKLAFSNAVDTAYSAAKKANATLTEINTAKDTVEKAYNKLDGKAYMLPCSLYDFGSGNYKLTDTDKTAILAVVNKAMGSTNAHFTDETNNMVSYTYNSIYTDSVFTSTFVTFAKQ